MILFFVNTCLLHIMYYYCSLYISWSADKENLFKIKSFINWWSFPWFSWSKCLIQGWYCKEKLEAGQSKGLKGYSFFFLNQTLISCHHSIIKGSPMVSLKKLSLEPCLVTFFTLMILSGWPFKSVLFSVSEHQAWGESSTVSSLSILL